MKMVARSLLYSCSRPARCLISVFKAPVLGEYHSDSISDAGAEAGDCGGRDARTDVEG